MPTLTGFENHHRTAQQWRDYLRRLHDRRAELVQLHNDLKAHDRLAPRDRCRFMSRYDVLSEHIDRAESQIK